MTASTDIDAVAAAVDKFPETAVRNAVNKLRAAIQPRLRRDTGGDNRLSGIGNAKLSVVTKVTGTQLVEGRVATARKGTAGPWRWLEDGTRPRTTASGGRHPGTDPKRTWSDPVRSAIPDVQAGIARDFEAVVR